MSQKTNSLSAVSWSVDVSVPTQEMPLESGVLDEGGSLRKQIPFLRISSLKEGGKEGRKEGKEEEREEGQAGREGENEEGREGGKQRRKNILREQDATKVEVTFIL